MLALHALNTQYVSHSKLAARDCKEVRPSFILRFFVVGNLSWIGFSGTQLLGIIALSAAVPFWVETLKKRP